MKKYVLAGFLIIITQSCDSNPASSISNETELPVLIENLAGQWNWVMTIDSTNNAVEYSSPGNSEIVIITNDYSFKRFINGDLVFDDTFKIIIPDSPVESVEFYYLDWDHSKYFNSILYNLTAESLVISIGLDDKNVYTKIY